jgi:hypothetical protein
VRIRRLPIFNERHATRLFKAQYGEADSACDKGDSNSTFAVCCGMQLLNKRIF